MIRVGTVSHCLHQLLNIHSLMVSSDLRSVPPRHTTGQTCIRRDRPPIPEGESPHFPSFGGGDQTADYLAEMRPSGNRNTVMKANYIAQIHEFGILSLATTLISSGTTELRSRWRARMNIAGMAKPSANPCSSRQPHQPAQRESSSGSMSAHPPPSTEIKAYRLPGFSRPGSGMHASGDEPIYIPNGFIQGRQRNAA